MQKVSLDDWVSSATPGESMLWRGSALAQFQWFRDLGAALGAEPLVVGMHRSKSIDLPVVELRVGDHTAWLRDNFYDVNLAVEGPRPIPWAPADVAEPRDWAWYVEQVDRKRGYCFRGWTDEEVADPRITRVEVTRADGGRYWSESSAGEKDRWARRLTDTEWHGRDWSSGELLVEGAVGPGAKFYQLDRAFLQGMDGLPSKATQPWRPGASSGVVAVSREQAQTLLTMLVAR